MNKILAFTFFALIGGSTFGFAQKQSLERYIEVWKNTAIQQMHTHGIPASITLSQGILESGFGNSKLAQQANNHFGIKCHDWEGESFLKDDDKRNECFRKYDDAAQSYEDHSLFLTSRSRYAPLFELKTTDYKGWAKGLKTAGYATNPAYAKRLIELIERYELYQYDQASTHDLIVEASISTKPTKKENNKLDAEQGPAKTTLKSDRKFEIFTNPNKTKYVLAGEHDTFYQISKSMGVSLHQLHRWNDFPPTKDLLKKGDKVYIMRKRSRINMDDAQLANYQNTDLWKVSQEIGVQLSSLLDKEIFKSSSIASN
ncbi:N-acetylmuramoyl-L-alanine amidase [Brumimicrobium salinarum]|uniref:Peptidoglycan hydrolase n=1 Tax=Brumimicrobium salinarum TaxID=2058658 RepID=A0A2I0R399_9FLAO|nr:glucosaminidase domain-containing protein [Brumimicrobium salinarum]PKR81035.1 N-acetylmuramoyl-L-alanine amidase [Brumimicrobium salinarum]